MIKINLTTIALLLSLCINLQGQSIVYDIGTALIIEDETKIIADSLDLINNGSILISERGQLSINGGENTGTIKLLAGKTGNASLINNRPYTGNLDIDVYIAFDKLDTYAGAGNLSSPIGDGTIADFNSLAAVSHLESARVNGSPYSDPLATSTALNPMEGYFVYYSDVENLITFSGKANDGVFTFPVTRTKYDPSGIYYGWNLVGNPYNSAISWQDIADEISTALNENISPTINIMDFGSQRWLVYNASLPSAGDAIDTIPVGQGFFVQLLDDGSGLEQYSGEFTLKGKYRVHSNDNFYLNTASENLARSRSSYPNYYFEVVATNAATNSIDKAYYHWNPNASILFDEEFDSAKLMAFGVDQPNLYFFSDDEMCAIQQEPETAIVKLGFNSYITSNIELSLKNVKNFKKIILSDKQEGTLTDLTLQSYTFTPGDNDDDRFVILLNKEILSDEIEEIESLKIYNRGNDIIIKSNEVLTNSKVFIYDTAGRKILQEELINKKENIIQTELNTGIYFIKLESDQGYSNKKIIIK